MKDKKTTITGAIRAGILILGLIGIQVSPENQKAIMDGAVAAYAVLTAIHGWLQKDK